MNEKMKESKNERKRMTNDWSLNQASWKRGKEGFVRGSREKKRRREKWKRAGNVQHVRIRTTKSYSRVYFCSYVLMKWNIQIVYFLLNAKITDQGTAFVHNALYSIYVFSCRRGRDLSVHERSRSVWLLSKPIISDRFRRETYLDWEFCRFWRKRTDEDW